MQAGRGDLTAVSQEPPTGLAANTREEGFTRSDSHQGWPDIEKQMIIEALIKANGRKNKAAVSLGWARSTLWRKMKHYGLH